MKLTINRREMWDLAQPLMCDMRQRLGSDYLQGGQEVQVGVSRDGTVYVQVDELMFFQDHHTKALTAGRKGDDGVEFGGVDDDGTIRWGEAMMPVGSMN